MLLGDLGDLGDPGDLGLLGDQAECQMSQARSEAEMGTDGDGWKCSLELAWGLAMTGRQNGRAAAMITFEG
ncbi:hypothetical protein E4U38_000728 [Claviceps purpurea]|nr:hypothetical protein E4U38_000728 [Claviceps purpurea]